MGSRLTEVRSETAYDALQDEIPLLARIQAHAGTLEEIAAREGVQDVSTLRKRLDRLVRAGLVRQVEGRFETVGQLLYAMRQDAMVSSLTRLVLPALTRMVAGGEGLLVHQDLSLELPAQAALRTGLVQSLLEDIDGLSEEPAEEKTPYTCIVIGTSDVPPNADRSQRLIESVRRAARQRSTPDVAGRAILLQYDGLFGSDAAHRAERRIQDAAASLESHRVGEGERGNYTFVLGFCSMAQEMGVGR